MAEGFITRRGGKGGVDVSDATATEDKVLQGETFYAGDENKKTGTIPSKSAQTFTPTTTNQTIAAGQFLSGTQTIQGDADLVAGNIKDGVTIFGVTGNVQSPSIFEYTNLTYTNTALYDKDNGSPTTPSWGARINKHPIISGTSKVVITNWWAVSAVYFWNGNTYLGWWKNTNRSFTASSGSLGNITARNSGIITMPSNATDFAVASYIGSGSDIPEYEVGCQIPLTFSEFQGAVKVFGQV